MKVVKISIFIGIILASCVQHKANKTLEIDYEININQISIPKIEKNFDDQSFNLVNGVLFFEEIPFSGIVNEFYQNGTIKTKSEYIDGRRKGYFKGWYESGNKWFDRYYDAGLKVGKHVGWFDNNGNLKFEYYFNNQGGYDGSVKEWYENGKLAKHFNFKNGVEAGSQKMWKPNGNIRANFYTINSERHGLIGLKNCVSVMSDTIK